MSEIESESDNLGGLQAKHLQIDQKIYKIDVICTSLNELRKAYETFQNRQERRNGFKK